MPGYYDFKPQLEGLRNHAQDIRGRFTRMQAATLAVHREAVTQMAEWAFDALDEKVKRAEGPGGRTGRLEDAIIDPKSHEATAFGFKFLLDGRMTEKVAYWRAIEHGSDHLVGRELHLQFGSQGGPIRPNPARRGQDPARIQSDWWPRVKITNPILPYHYAQAAEDKFKANNFAWYRIRIIREAQARGLDLRTGDAKG